MFTVDCHFLVPFGRNADFVGRESVVEQLRGRVPPSAIKDDCQRTAVAGLGGIGKTQVALETAYCIRDQYPACSVFWVPAIDATSFEKAYREIGKALGVQGLNGNEAYVNDNEANVKLLVKAALSHESASEWLLIIDNADNLKLFADSALADHLPFNRNGSILFTTRNYQAAVRLGIRNCVTVQEMSDTEAFKLLQTGLKKSQISDSKSTTQLLNFLTNLPLAIKQASSYMAEWQISTAEYLNYCNSSNETTIELLSCDFEDLGRYKAIENPVATTWLLSFNHILRDMPFAARYLEYICFLAEKNIPMSLLPSGKNKLEVDKVIGILKGHAFILKRENLGSFDVHRLVRLVMQNWIKEQQRLEGCLTFTIQQLSRNFPVPKHENKPIWIQYLPHGQAALNFRKFCTDKKVKADLLFKVGESCSVLGKYNEGETMLREALALKEAALGREHPEMLSIMNNLALVLSKQRKYDEAETMSQKVLEFTQTLPSMNNLALVLNRQGKYEDVETMFRQALPLFQAALGREHPNTLKSMNNIERILDRQRDDELEQIL